MLTTRPVNTDIGTRQRVFAAASTEFATRGFAGANVDRIARTAGVNKAMIYYHFKSKAALYREILRDMFDAVDARLEETGGAGLEPAAKIRAFVEAIAYEAEARPHFPAIWFREIAEDGTHIDDGIASSLGAIIRRLAAIVKEGVKAGTFTPVDPLLVHAGIVGPLLFFYASAALRKRMARAGIRGADAYESRDVIAHVQRVALATLEGRV